MADEERATEVEVQEQENGQDEDNTESESRKRKRQSGWGTAPSEETKEGQTPETSDLECKLAKLTPEQRKAYDSARSFAYQTQQQVKVLQQQAQLQQAQMQSMMQPLFRPAQPPVQVQSKIYVGGLDPAISENDLKTCFEPFGTIKSVQISVDPVTKQSRGYAFLEFTSPEPAAAAIETMNGFQLAGRTIKVGRPHSVTNATPQAVAPGLNIVRPPVNTRIYVGSVNWDLSEADIRQVFEAFGKILSCTLLPNPETGKHKGYGFVEYETVEAADAAIDSMHGFELGGRTLKVGKAVSANPPSVAPSPLLNPAAIANNPALPALQNIQGLLAASGAQMKSSAEESLLSMEENMSISSDKRMEVMKLLQQRVDGSDQLRTLCLYNMVTPSELDADLQDEVTAEASKYGKVERVVIFHDEEKEEVLVYVVFNTSEAAAHAKSVFNGRWFGGRVIRAELPKELPFDL